MAEIYNSQTRIEHKYVVQLDVAMEDVYFCQS